MLHSCRQIIIKWHLIPNWKCFSPFECNDGTYLLHAHGDDEMEYYLKKTLKRCHVSHCQGKNDKMFIIFVLLNIRDVLGKEYPSNLHICHTKNKDMITNSKLFFFSSGKAPLYPLLKLAGTIYGICVSADLEQDYEVFLPPI